MVEDTQPSQASIGTQPMNQNGDSQSILLSCVDSPPELPRLWNGPRLGQQGPGLSCPISVQFSNQPSPNVDFLLQKIQPVTGQAPGMVRGRPLLWLRQVKLGNAVLVGEDLESSATQGLTRLLQCLKVPWICISQLIISGGHDDLLPQVAPHLPGPETPLHSLELLPHPRGNNALTCSQKIFRATAVMD